MSAITNDFSNMNISSSQPSVPPNNGRNHPQNPAGHRKNMRGQGPPRNQRIPNPQKNSNRAERIEENKMNGAPSVGLANPVDPRAVIIKNIPFHLSRPAMLEMINKMDMPKPYAMNYLFDNGMFHGLAFANFETEEETKIAIEKLNGLDVMGRKLVVQAKQVQSSQSQPYQQHQAHRSQQGGYPPFLPQQSRRGPFNSDNSMYRHYHNEIQAFLGNPALEELNFPTSLSNEERKVIHIVADKLGIQHVSLGEGKERFVKVTKQPLPVKQPPVVRKEPPTRPVFKLKQAISNESISAVVPCRQPYGPDPKPENNFKQRIGSRKLNVNAAEFIVEST